METTTKNRRIQTSVMLDPDVHAKVYKVAKRKGDVSGIINRAVRSMFDLRRPVETAPDATT